MEDGNLGADGKIILKQILKRLRLRIWTELIYTLYHPVRGFSVVIGYSVYIKGRKVAK
jgi:hypothetical protein